MKLFNWKKEAWNKYFFTDKTFPEVDLELGIWLNIEIKHKIKTWQKCILKCELKLKYCIKESEPLTYFIHLYIVHVHTCIVLKEFKYSLSLRNQGAPDLDIVWYPIWIWMAAPYSALLSSVKDLQTEMPFCVSHCQRNLPIFLWWEILLLQTYYRWAYPLSNGKHKNYKEKKTARFSKYAEVVFLNVKFCKVTVCLESHT